MNHVFVLVTRTDDLDGDESWDEEIKKVKHNLAKVIRLEGWKLKAFLDAPVDSDFDKRLIAKSGETLEEKLDLQYSGTFVEYINNIEARRYVLSLFPDALLDDSRGSAKFQVELPLTQKDEFYTRMVIRGWALDCFNFMLMVGSNNLEYQRQILEWLEMAKKIKEEEKAT